MELSETISVRKFKEFNELQKNELCATLIELAEAIDEIPRKSLKKTLDITLAALKYKTEQINELKQLDQDQMKLERVLNENEKLKAMLDKLEHENAAGKQKIKELNDEIFQMQKRLEEATHISEASDRDSSDPLSELDKQEELLQNINTKNKHIRRLLHEIETLQVQNIEQSKTIMQFESELKDCKSELEKCEEIRKEEEQQRQILKQTVKTLKIEIARLESNVTYLEEEREKTENELRDFVSKYEERTQNWRQLIEEKDVELCELRKIATATNTSTILGINNSNTETSEHMNKEYNNLLFAIETRDKIIEQLESKIKSMANEMLASAAVMNKLSSEQDTVSSKMQNACCKQTGYALQASNERCSELSEMLTNCEEENRLQSKRVQQMQNTLEAYQRGEDGLAKVMRKCAAVERKLMSRDKQIRALVNELNTMHEVAQENQILRERLNIGDDETISTKYFVAKERNKQKIIDKLILKLNASEEARLQLELDIINLRKEIMGGRQEKNPIQECLELDISDMPNQRKETSEIGEVEDTSIADTMPEIVKQPQANICEEQLREYQDKYQELLEENETLRNGMHEILEKLTNYNDASSCITIDKELLQQLLAALQMQQEPSNESAQHLQAELLELREQEQTLNVVLNETVEEEQTGITDMSLSMPQLRESDVDDNAEGALVIPEPMPYDTSTRPTTPCANLDITKLLPDIDPITPEQLTPTANNAHNALDYQQQYEQLKLQIGNSDSETKRYCAQLIEDMAAKDLQLTQQKLSFSFLQEELDKALNQYRVQELQHIKDTAALKQKVNAQMLAFRELEAAHLLYKQQHAHNETEFMDLQKSKQMAESQLAKLIDQVLSGQLSEDLRVHELCINYGVIEEDLQLTYITAKEYEQRNANFQEAIEKYDELRRQLNQLEGLLQIAQDQIHSQQKLINELTDNHINLRHLVADLQSTNEDKFLLAKMQRELDAAKLEITRIKDECAKLVTQHDELQQQCKEKEQYELEKDKHITFERNNNSLKIKFLQKSLLILREKYAKFTPLVFLTNFVYAYTKFIKSTSTNVDLQLSREHVSQIVQSCLTYEQTDENNTPNYIKCIHLDCQRQLLEENVTSLQQKCQSLELELNELRIQQATENEHWKTIEALFDAECALKRNQAAQQFDENKQSTVCHVGTEPVSIILVDKALSPLTIPMQQATDCSEAATTTTSTTEQAIQTSDLSKKITEVITQTAIINVESRSIQTSTPIEIEKFDVQLQAALDKINEQQNLLNSKESEITAAKCLITQLESKLSVVSKQAQTNTVETKNVEQQADVIEKTIISFHNLLSEKDLSIGKYQELLQNQREQSQISTVKLEAEIESLKNTITNLNYNIKAKDMEIMELQNKLQAVRCNFNEIAADIGATGENSLNEITDEKLEEMFQQQENISPHPMHEQTENLIETEILEKQDREPIKEMPALLQQVKELKDKITYIEQTDLVKEEELHLLREKLHFYQEREKKEQNMSTSEIDKLRELLEEKDKHINDLMNTLRSFHDDQERFLHDATNYSADQLAKLATDLKRSEATNQIYQTQLEAMRRQINSLTQREKQIRELNTTLRNELIKRPVVSIKTELNARVKNENLQKRIQQLEHELEESRAQLQRQQTIIDAKRTKSANEVNLWEKQKRWQQNAEKLKTKLDDTDTALEKTRTLLQSARNTIARLEKEKLILETKLNKVMTGCSNAISSMKCCRTPSCPNLQHNNAKYTPSVTPETFTGVSSESSSPVHSATTGVAANTASNHLCTMLSHTMDTHHLHHDRGNEFLIEALKARIELQQRKLLAMELEGKGRDALTIEIEKLEERCSAIEAQNIRLEAKNLQLQLDNDLLKQGDNSERLQKRIKHLEDYIIALKEEIAAAETRQDICNCIAQKKATLNSYNATQQQQLEHKNSADQTILSLRNIVEKLRAENKYLKENRRANDASQANMEQLSTQLKTLKKKYANAMEKISQMNAELLSKPKCPVCSAHNKAGAHGIDELKFIKEQLTKKTQLLQKAKVLLTRAAAKEKVLKEQVALWKRKCSELQNVPVIEEISE